MKIALYGVSRCGKDYLIQRVLETVRGLRHLRGSATLKQLAIEKFGIDFDVLDEADKNILRIALADKAKLEEQVVGNIIVDGHYSFPDDDGSYHVVFTEADRQLYDVFVYMSTNPQKVIENQKTPDPSRTIRQYSEEMIDAWQRYEVANMQAVCKSLGTELLVIDGDIDCAVDFISELIHTPQHIIPRLIAKQAVEARREVFKRVDTVILTDCDKTLAINDTTMTFCDSSGIDKQAIRDNYRGEYYSTYQFFRANRFYDEVLSDKRYYAACDHAAVTAQMNKALISDIKSESGGFTTFAVTSGILDIWERIQVRQDFPDIVVGKGRAKDGGIYVSTLVKQAIAEELCSLGKRVIAIGDSPIDIGMLEMADHGYIVAMSKRSTGVEAYLAQTPQSRIRQLEYSTCKYNNIEESQSIWQS